MGWHLRKKDLPPPHEHDYPNYVDGEDIRVGDIWECSCPNFFEVVSFTQASDGTRINWVRTNV